MNPANGRWSGDRLEIALDLIASAGGGTHVIPVVGESMEPTLADGDAVLVDLGRRGPRFGEIVVFRQERELVVHRFLGVVRSRRHGRHLRMRGDGRPTFDPPVARGQVLGVVRAARRDGRWWDLERPPARAWAIAVACHGRFWGFAAGAVRRLRGGPSRAEGRVAGFDRAALRVAHRATFRVFHRRIPDPRAASGRGGDGPEALL